MLVCQALQAIFPAAMSAIPAALGDNSYVREGGVCFTNENGPSTRHLVPGEGGC